MKRIRTTVKNALSKNYIKKGNKIWIECDVVDFMHSSLGLPLSVRISGNPSNDFIYDRATILITKPKPVPIDFGAKGRVLKGSISGVIIITTGYVDKNGFSGYVIQPAGIFKKGLASDAWTNTQSDWQDITETYKP
jgi:hypothetical protein